MRFKEIAKMCPWNDHGACSVRLFIDKRGKPHLRACKKKHCAPWYFVKGPCNTQMHMDSNKVSADCVCKKCGRGPYVNSGLADNCCQ